MQQAEKHDASQSKNTLSHSAGSPTPAPTVWQVIQHHCSVFRCVDVDSKTLVRIPNEHCQMTDLKDQFALAAMAALLQRTSNSWPDYPDVATSAWHCAEFMMTERQKRIDLAALNEKRNNSDMRTLKLSTRLHYALLSEDLYTIADICAYTEKEILKIPNIGRTQLAHLIAALATVGESLAVPGEK